MTPEWAPFTDARRERMAAEQLWNAKVKAAHVLYLEAQIARSSLQVERHYMPRADGSFALQRAIIAENVALAEYYRVLQIFTQLTVHGVRPPE